MSIKSTTVMSVGRGGEKEKKKETENNLQNKSKHKNNQCVFCCCCCCLFVFVFVSAVRICSRTGSHSPPHLPKMPSNTVLISGPAVWVVQVLICSYSCVFLPPMSTAIRTSMFSSVGALNVFLYIS